MSGKEYSVRATWVMVLVACLLLTGCAIRDEMTRMDSHVVSLSNRHADLEKRVTSLERDKRALSSVNTQLEKQLQIFQTEQRKTEKELREQFASLRATNNRLREEIQNLLGRAEMSEHLLKQKTQDQGDFNKEWDRRYAKLETLIETNRQQIEKFEAYLHLESSGPGTAVKPTVERTLQTLSEDELYKLAKQSFDKQEYDQSREAFQVLLERFPQSQNADNAQFWIGEIYYREKWYEKSILEYQKVIETYPNGNKVPASLLKQGLAFMNIGDNANARLILKELVKKYPKSSEATIAQKTIKGLE